MVLLLPCLHSTIAWLQPSGQCLFADRSQKLQCAAAGVHTAIMSHLVQVCSPADHALRNCLLVQSSVQCVAILPYTVTYRTHALTESREPHTVVCHSMKQSNDQHAFTDRELAVNSAVRNDCTTAYPTGIIHSHSCNQPPQVCMNVYYVQTYTKLCPFTRLGVAFPCKCRSRTRNISEYGCVCVCVCVAGQGGPTPGRCAYACVTSC